MYEQNDFTNLISDNARLNETIKDVVRLSRKLYLDSLNARFAVRRSGDSAAGFVAVTSQLRMLSSQMNDAMLLLQQDVAMLMQTSARIQRQRHMAVLAHAAIAQSEGDAGSDSLERFRERILDYRRNGDTELKRSYEQIGQRLRMAQRICMTGGDLAVVAKIEAGQTGVLSRILSQVAGDVEASVAAMAETLDTLSRRFTHSDRLAA